MNRCKERGCWKPVAHEHAIACELHYETYTPPVRVDLMPEWRQRRLAEAQVNGRSRWSAVKDTTERTGL